MESLFGIKMFILPAILLTIQYAHASEQHHAYCVVGAGASGLQMTAHLAHDQLDVILIEQSKEIGSFWKKFPINRKLRSIHHHHVR